MEDSLPSVEPRWTLPDGHFFGRTVEDGPSHLFGSDGRSKCDTYTDADVIEGVSSADGLPDDVCGTCAGVVQYIELVEVDEQ